MVWTIRCGDDPEVQVQGYGTAIDFLIETIRDCKLPGWRTAALVEQAKNMPRAGFAFTDNNGVLVKVEMTR